MIRTISSIDSNVALFECIYSINQNLFSDNMQSILGLNEHLWKEISKSPEKFEKYLQLLISRTENQKVIMINDKFISISSFKEKDGFYGIIIDKSEDVKWMYKIKQELYHTKIKSEIDSLTGLKNRSGLEKNIKTLLKNKFNKGTLLIFDLDNFKLINDKLGHPEGDKVLKKFAYFLKLFFGKDDIIGRIGGDEFVVFMKHNISVELISYKLQTFLQVIHDELNYYNINYKLSTSIGVAYVNNVISSYEDLYKYADIALYMAKKLGKDGFYIYN